MIDPLLEVCVDGVDGVAAAHAGGADRIELCANLAVGGTTPSAGTIRAAVQQPLPVVVLIRSRSGDFVFSDAEHAAMLDDIETSIAEGALGVAVGALTANGTIDTARLADYRRAAGNAQVTFHRAFDMVRDPFAALETLIEHGVDRVLTSGGEASVTEGTSRLAELVTRAGDRISIMPGGGLRPANAAAIRDATGAREYHGSARSPATQRVQFENPRCELGPVDPQAPHGWITDPDQVAALAAALRGA